jgi:hypothetical protein
LFSKPVELDGIKIRVFELVPNANGFDGVSVPEAAEEVACVDFGLFLYDRIDR